MVSDVRNADRDDVSLLTSLSRVGMCPLVARTAQADEVLDFMSAFASALSVMEVTVGVTAAGALSVLSFPDNAPRLGRDS